MLIIFFSCFFFFQAEDGIRDIGVTGVQTCALPIFVNTALSRIAEDLDTGLSGLQWVVDAYTLALAATVLTAGSIADRIGRRRLFVWGLVLFTLTSVACALATDITMLNTARAVQGIGAAILFAVSLALLAHAFPGAKERAGALAIYGATIGASFAVGPLVGGALTSGLDWQWIFAVNIPIGLVGVWLTKRYVEESKDPDRKSTRLNSSHANISYAVFCLKKKS